VSRYFDLVAFYTPALKANVMRGLEMVDAEAMKQFGKAFAGLDRGQQTKVVEVMARNEGKATNDFERFFEVLKFHTVEGYRLSHIGQTEWLQYKPHPGGLYPDGALDGK